MGKTFKDRKDYIPKKKKKHGKPLRDKKFNIVPSNWTDEDKKAEKLKWQEEWDKLNDKP